MSDLFEKYFGDREYHDAMAGVMYGIFKNKIPAEDVAQLADELVQKALIPEKSSFEKRECNGWNQGYVNYLMNGMSAGKISKEYLIFYTKVCNGVRKKRKWFLGICIAFGLLVISMLIAIWASKMGVPYGTK